MARNLGASFNTVTRDPTFEAFDGYYTHSSDYCSKPNQVSVYIIGIYIH